MVALSRVFLGESGVTLSQSLEEGQLPVLFRGGFPSVMFFQIS